MRQVILDTETTGLEVQRGHRIIEIGCVELVQRRPTGRTFHHYLNPDREIDEGARAVTGISDEFLRDKPRFADIVHEFLAFIDGAEVIAHNAAFDVGFLDAELARAGVERPRMAERAFVLRPLADVTRGLAGDPDDLQARFIEAVVSTATGVMRVCCIYLPNGNPPDTEKYPYKLGFMERLKAFTAERLALEEPLVLAGDFNVIPAAVDAADPAAWTGDALFLPKTRSAFRELIHLGLTDAVRASSDAERLYTFWDYQAGAWQRDNGIRIDHLLLSPQAADKLITVGIDKHVRAWEKPSDHVPVGAGFAIAS